MDSMSGMDGMSSGSSTVSMGMSMSVIFQTSISTSLYSSAWTPTTVGAYAGTCIFLIMLAALLQALLAVRQWMEGRWIDQELNRRYVVVQGKAALSETISRDSLSKRMTLTENGVEEDVVVVRRRRHSAMPWRLSIDPIRAVITTLTAAVGYFLMLGVMTMNVGYFASILGGTFVGSLICGRFVANGEH